MIRGLHGQTILRSQVGSSDYESFGAALAIAPDMDGDAIEEIVVGSPGLMPAPAVSVFSGASGALLHSLHGQSSSFALGGLDSAGDVDQDGRDDLVVGEYFWNGFEESRVWVISGATGTVIHEIEGDCNLLNGESQSEALGYSAAGVGDIDLDGIPDFAAGTNRFHVVKVFSGSDGSLLGVYRSGQSCCANRIHIAALSDISGDGRREIVVAFDHSGPTLYTGKLIVYSDAVQTAQGTSFALGDGSGAPCPCGNTGQAGAGCANSTGLGGALLAFGSPSVTLDDFYLEAHVLPPNASALLYTGTTQLAGGFGNPFGDGLRAVGGAIRRLEVHKSCADGKTWWGSELQLKGAWQAGDSRGFQVWYRDPSGPCGFGFNLTNAVWMTFAP